MVAPRKRRVSRNNDYRNDLIDENRAPDAVEDLILKAANAPDKKVRVVERKQDEAR